MLAGMIGAMETAKLFAMTPVLLPVLLLMDELGMVYPSPAICWPASLVSALVPFALTVIGFRRRRTGRSAWSVPLYMSCVVLLEVLIVLGMIASAG